MDIIKAKKRETSGVRWYKSPLRKQEFKHELGPELLVVDLNLNCALDRHLPSPCTYNPNENSRSHNTSQVSLIFHVQAEDECRNGTTNYDTTQCSQSQQE